jgi:Ca2+-transporting ATPase
VPISTGVICRDARRRTPALTPAGGSSRSIAAAPCRYPSPIVHLGIGACRIVGRRAKLDAAQTIAAAGLTRRLAPPHTDRTAEPGCSHPASGLDAVSSVIHEAMTAPSPPPRAEQESWHTRSADASLQALASRASGLEAEEAAARLRRHGANTLPEGARRSPARILLDQFGDVMILVLLAAAVISGLVGEVGDTAAIVVIVALNAGIGFFQELRAERAMAALRRMAAPLAHVRRGGRPADIAAAEVVPGDIVLLEAGNVVPADLRLLETMQMRVSEAALTGESQPVDKQTAALPDAALAIGDRSNMAWKGTLVAHGRGCGVVVATGLDTELGRIARLLAAAEEVKTPLQRRLARFGGRLAWAVLALCALMLVAGLARGEPPTLMFLTAVSLAVAAIPEALPAVVAIALALGAAKMVQQHVLVRRLPAVETLGSITYICTDKTGTLTENRMRAEHIDAGGGPPDAEPWPSLLRAMALVNDADLGSSPPAGDPTEIALLEAAAAHGWHSAELQPRLPRIAEAPFDAERKRMSTLHAEGDGRLLCVKGAPETVLVRCPWRLTAAGIAPFDAEAALAQADALAARGLRVLAFAQRRVAAADADADVETHESDLVYLGMVGLLDPPRAEAAAAVAQCRSAGIVPVMITGDHPGTARAIAVRLGILGEDGRVVGGSELAAMSDAALAQQVASIRVYARADPAQKIRIVEALQAASQFVAMTGDGVNDAPALKRADIGIAMGRSGADVAREAAHMVLLDDDFSSIVHAVREGRRIYDNIRKFIKYVMTGNSGEIWAIFLAPFVGLPIPLLPIHILWINLVTDGLPGLALAAEPAERDIMRRPPRAPDESIFAHGMWQHIVWVGFAMGAVCLLLQAYAYHSGDAHWQTMVFTVLCLSQLGHVIAIRSERDSVFVIGFASNRALFATVLGTVVLQLATVYVPALNPVFKTEPLSAVELLVCALASSIVFFAVEAEKWLRRRERPAPAAA